MVAKRVNLVYPEYKSVSFVQSMPVETYAEPDAFLQINQIPK